MLEYGLLIALFIPQNHLYPLQGHYLDIDLQGWTTVMGLEHGMAPVYTILTSTTLESNKSVVRLTTWMGDRPEA